MPLTPATRLGVYEILAPLGAGGMGEVYRARDTRLGREIAVKVLPDDVASSPSRLALFEREARAVASLNHPNIVTLHSIEEIAGVRFLTMELIEGQDLSHVVTPGGLPLARVMELAIPLAEALTAAHEKGVVHRDLKPANVMVTREGRVKVLDFGLAKLTPANPDLQNSQAATMTALSTDRDVVGTAQYMAPEQICGEPVDARADLFSFGVLIYELASGKRPFAGRTILEVSSAILRDTAPPLTSVRSDVPVELERIIGRCLEKQPRDRFQSALDVTNGLRELKRWLERGGPAQPKPPSEHAASIAVLPFLNRGQDQEDEYFADGITEDVIAQLCKVRALKVISRNSVMLFKGSKEGLREIASKLQVANVLEGNVRRVGDRVRIVAQLVEPVSGRSVWAETYDRKLTDIFEIQTEVALSIAAALQAELSPHERERLRREPTRDVRAYELYLHGRQRLGRFTMDDLKQSIVYFGRAIERDADFAPAHVGLAIAHTELAELGAMDRNEAGANALSAAAKAVALDPDLGDAHCALAYARMVFEHDWSAAEEGFKRAIELSPGDAFAYDYYGRMCAALERFEEALSLQGKANELDPLTQRIDLATSLLRAGRNEDATHIAARAVEMEPKDSRLRATLGWALFRQGLKDEGIAELELAASLKPHETMWLAQLGQAYGLAGRVDKASEVLQALEDPSRPAPTSPYHLAYVYLGLGDEERAIECLELAYDRGIGPVYGIKGSFLLAPLRSHPRFAALLKRMRLP